MWIANDGSFRDDGQRRRVVAKVTYFSRGLTVKIQMTLMNRSVQMFIDSNKNIKYLIVNVMLSWNSKQKIFRLKTNDCLKIYKKRKTKTGRFVDISRRHLSSHVTASKPLFDYFNVKLHCGKHVDMICNITFQWDNFSDLLCTFVV